MARRIHDKRFVVQISLLLTGVGLQAIGCGEVRYRDAFRADDVVRKVVFRGDVGVVEIVPSSSAKVDLAVRAPEGAALVQHSQVDGVFEVTTKCRTPILCAGDAEVFVPDGVPVDVEIDRGEVWSTGVQDLNVSVGEGDVDLDTAGPTTVQVGHGTARVVANSPESLRIAVANGDIDVQVVPERWNLSLTGASESVSGVVMDPQAHGALELVAPSGMVKVQPLARKHQDSGTP